MTGAQAPQTYYAGLAPGEVGANENPEMENVGPSCRDGKYRTGRFETKVLRHK